MGGGVETHNYVQVYLHTITVYETLIRDVHIYTLSKTLGEENGR